MSTLAGTDAFVVNRAGVNYQVTAANFMSTVLDTDLFVVNRGTVNYKVTGLDVKNYFGGSGGGGLITFGVSLQGLSEMGGPATTTFDGSKYYLGQTGPSGNGYGVGNSQLYFTSIDGKNFDRVARGGNPLINAVIVASDGSLLGAGCTDGNPVRGGGSVASIYRSTDGGSSWGLTLPVNKWYTAQTMNIDPTNGKIGVAAGSNFYESSDDGVTWTTISLTSVTNAGIYTALGGFNSNTPHALVGYGGNWYFFGQFGAFGRLLLTIPQGSTGAVTPTWNTLGGNAANASSLDVSRGLGTDFFIVGVYNSGLRTYDTSYNLISSTGLQPTNIEYYGNWVPAANKAYGGGWWSGSGGIYSGPNFRVYTSTNGSWTDVSSVQPAQTVYATSFWSVGASVFTAASNLPFTCPVGG